MTEETSYWQHTIIREKDSGGDEVVATYISCTSPKVVEQDLASPSSQLRDYIERFFNVSADQFAYENPERAQQLVGALEASLHCSLEHGWLPMSPPPTIPVPKPESLEQAIHTVSGACLWKIS